MACFFSYIHRVRLGSEFNLIAIGLGSFMDFASLMIPLQQFLDALSQQDWAQKDGPMRLSGKLTIADYAHAPLATNVRVFMRQLEAEGGSTSATATGNLKRAFVERVFEDLDMPAPWRETIRHINKVINETDVSVLRLARVVADCGGFVIRRKNHFVLTAKGKKLLADSNAGEFYRALFIAYLRNFNLAYMQPRQDVPSIQHTMLAILWRIDAVLKEWTPFKGLAPRILMPLPLQHLRAAITSPYDTEESILIGYLIKPLFDLGLLEADKADSNTHIFFDYENVQLRISRLWRQFIWFEWQV